MIKKVYARSPNVSVDQGFWIHNTGHVNNLLDLREAISKIDDDTFRHHVNEEKNDFSNWIGDVLQSSELALKVKNASSRQMLMSVLEDKKSNIRLNAFRSANQSRKGGISLSAVMPSNNPDIKSVVKKKSLKKSKKEIKIDKSKKKANIKKNKKEISIRKTKKIKGKSKVIVKKAKKIIQKKIKRKAVKKIVKKPSSSKNVINQIKDIPKQALRTVENIPKQAMKTVENIPKLNIADIKWRKSLIRGKDMEIAISFIIGIMVGFLLAKLFFV